MHSIGVLVVHIDIQRSGESLTLKILFFPGMAAVAVPGELNGFGEAWEKYGRLPWKKLFDPSVALCTKGWSVSEAMAKALQKEEKAIRSNAGLR